MFFTILSYFQDNRKKLFLIAGVIGIVILFMYVVHNRSEYEVEVNSSSSNSTTAINQSTTNNNRNLVVSNSTSNKVTYEESSINSVSNSLTAFIYYCNNNQIDDAYSLLTDECKEVLYPNQNDFYENYYKKIFATEMEYTYSTYIASENIYKVTFYVDPLTTGQTDTSNSITEYITIVDVDGVYKLNLSGFVKKEELNITDNNSYVDATVISKETYIDYEIYNVKMKNTTLVSIALSEMQNSKEIYLQDSEGNNFFILNNEYSEYDVTLDSGEEDELELKFNRAYKSTNNDIEKIVFSKVKLTNRKIYDNTTNEIKTTTYDSEVYFEIDL